MRHLSVGPPVERTAGAELRVFDMAAVCIVNDC